MKAMSTEQGLVTIILLPMLILGLLLTALSLQRLDFTLSQVKNRGKNRMEAFRARNRSLLELQTHLNGEDSTFGVNVQCSSPPFQYCLETTPKEREPSRLRNYNRFFELISPCPVLTTLYERTAAWGRPPTVASSRNCESFEKGVSVFRLRENLDLVLSEGDNNKQLPRILGSLGCIRIKGLVILTGDTFMLAGGDIVIDQVMTEGGENFSLYLYAATGRVEVESISKGVDLSTYSKKTGWKGNWKVLVTSPEALPPLEALFLGRTP